MTDPRDTVQVENVVASTGVDQELNLEQVSHDLPVADYDPDNFPGLVYRMSDPNAASLIFRSGKIVCTGANSEANVRTAIRNTVNALADLGIEVNESPKIVIQNVVSGADLGQTLNLNAIAIGLGLENIEYEPEQFPGLVYRLDEPKVVVLLFGSGKAVITGAKAVSDAENAIDAIRDQLVELGLME